MYIKVQSYTGRRTKSAKNVDENHESPKPQKTSKSKNQRQLKKLPGGVTMYSGRQILG